MPKGLVYGVGVNDVGWLTQKKVELPKVNGKRKQKVLWVCPYYDKWKKMLERCYSAKCQTKYPSYKGCTVAEEWHKFSSFVRWVDEQPNRDWMNCNLDKDLLIEGNKIYSTETCVFIKAKINSFLTDRAADRGDWLIGVIWNKKGSIFEAWCSNPENNKQYYLGCFPTEIEAHLTWKAKKHEHACKLAETEDDLRVKQALRERYNN